ncbi:hypothetical protein H2Y56_06165 [Pectobacterium aroidearum]|uniref:Uncharacterized protein n=1 Tax=Pectobacterium aroidearum TaxID=1201031 RepID=A0ABR5ZAU6_9GAMM|nr:MULTISPECIES: hypothetical protein [Pectobacterium]MBA5198910.1 hypothetical protein [Pectobacterium aroidearum]MBA5230121.1 hypothetical protein [Pectobacterium aroidearum]MBA5231702.1 hypothetical protein [Pectobacterium aroidearum]MBA5739254.1 hypothetical protein [Pectobacterium aroidearum]UXJ99846.1 hypothetical protein N5056_19090 [Pectobacterium aroidearum]
MFDSQMKQQAADYLMQELLRRLDGMEGSKRQRNAQVGFIALAEGFASAVEN